MSNVHEERAAMMIAAGELQPFVPFGREHCQRHPSAVNLQLRQLQPAPELWCSDGTAGLVGSLQEVSLQEREKVGGVLHQHYCFLHLSTDSQNTSSRASRSPMCRTKYFIIYMVFVQF